MSPEFYAIIGVGVSTIGVLSGLMIFLFNILSRRIDRLEMRMDRLEDKFDRLEDKFDRLEDKFDRLQEQMISLERQLLALEKRVSKLEWMLDAALYGKPVTFPNPPEADAENDSESQVT